MHGLFNYLHELPDSNLNCYLFSADMFVNQIDRDTRYQIALEKFGKYPQHKEEYWFAYDILGLSNTLFSLKKGRSVDFSGLYSKKTYTLDSYLNIPLGEIFQSHIRTIILTEGTSLVHPLLRPLFDRLYFMHTPEFLCLERMQKTRANDDSQVVEKYFKNLIERRFKIEYSEICNAEENLRVIEQDEKGILQNPRTEINWQY
jgi:uridine kinase